jgi:hypothetical protein
VGARVDVSSDASRRTLPQALILALLVDGTGAFLAEESRGVQGDHAAEAGDVLPDGAVAGTTPNTTDAASDGSAALDGSMSAPHSVEALVLPHTPGPPSAPQMPVRPRHAKPRQRAAEEVRPPDLTERTASRGRHRAVSQLVHHGLA